MFFNSGDLGYQGINETVDLGFDGSQEGFVLHQIEGFGELGMLFGVLKKCTELWNEGIWRIDFIQ